MIKNNLEMKHLGGISTLRVTLDSFWVHEIQCYAIFPVFFNTQWTNIVQSIEKSAIIKKPSVL